MYESSYVPLPLPYTVLIGVCCKNTNQHLTKLLSNIEKYAMLFKKHRIMFIDGNSTDGTYEKCKEWIQKDKDRREIYQQPLTDLPRPLALSEARNMLVILLEKYFKEGVYLLLLDADEVNTDDFLIDNFLSCFKYKDWSGMFASQGKEYYDIWALRSEKCPYDCWDMVKKYGHPDIFVKAHQTPPSKDSPLILVQSAFGGAGLYHTKDIIGIRYKSFILTEEGRKEICEHVPFNQEIVNRGGKLYINPAWINKN